MPVRSAGDPDQAGRVRPDPDTGAGAASAGFDADRAAHRTALRPNQEIFAGLILDNLERVSGSLRRARPGNLGHDRRGSNRDPPGRRRRRPDRRAGGHHQQPAEPGRTADDQRPSLGDSAHRTDDGRAGRRDRRCAARHPGLLQPDPARGRAIGPRSARDLRILARGHRAAQPARHRRGDRRPAPARLSRRRKRRDRP